MRFAEKTLIAALLALSATVIARAQQTGAEGAPKVELAFGYTYLLSAPTRLQASAIASR